jgi:PAS domain S-box-containing protein
MGGSTLLFHRQAETMIRQLFTGILRDIGGHDGDAAEAVALREKQFSEMMIESMPGAIYFYDDTGRFLRWNRNLELVSGYSAAEIAAMHPLEFFAEADRPLLEQRIKRVFAEGEASVEAPLRTKAGLTVPYFFTGRRIRFDGKDCLVGMGIDISERKRAEEELRRADLNLRQSEQKYRELVQNANSIILRWTRDGRIAFINEFGQKFFGFSEAELLGRHVMETIVPRNAESGGRDLAA